MSRCELNSYDIAIQVKDAFSGMYDFDIHDMLTHLKTDSAWPFQIRRDGRTYVGFITSDAAKALGDNYLEGSEIMENILKDLSMRNPLEQGEGDYRGTSYYIAGTGYNLGYESLGLETDRMELRYNLPKGIIKKQLLTKRQ
jgi:hypothetical protein